MSHAPRLALRRHVLPLVAVALALLALTAPRAQQSVFKAAVDSVRVDVEVRRGGGQSSASPPPTSRLSTTVCGSAPN